MRAAAYRLTGAPDDVLRVTERPEPVPGAGEVVVAVARSGVNPTDWKSMQGSRPGEALPFPEQVPGQDGAGTIVAAGAGVDAGRVGQRVWLWEAAYQRPEGTAQELCTIPSSQAVPMPDGVSFDDGASVGIPYLTAHRALTVGEGGPAQLAPGALDGATVLVAGGAGAVGHAAIELARWSGATVISTVSSDAKAALASRSGAHHVVDYTKGDAEAAIRRVAAAGIDIVVEVAPVANAALDTAVVAPSATVAAYANDGDAASIPVRPSMAANTRWQFVLVYTTPEAAKRRAVESVAAALADGAVRTGADAGLPIHHYDLPDIARAYRAVQEGAVGKVLVDIR